MKKPYIKKIATVSKFSVYFVDGEYVRDRMTRNSPTSASTSGSASSPKTNSGSTGSERRVKQEFFIDHMLVENRLMAKGMGYDDALVRADRAEMKERRKSLYIKKGIRPRRKTLECIPKFTRSSSTLLHGQD